VKKYPALDLRFTDVDLLYAALDDFSPTAIEERSDGIRAFFLTTSDRDAAHCALAPQFRTSPVEVPDDDWARRSQENLTPITVGRITIVPRPDAALLDPDAITIVVVPSMGFGTGHHATTRLCLAALQDVALAGRVVLDVGTGSGVLAMAARRLGAARAVGIDSDPDAIESARDNLALNPAVDEVEFVLADLSASPLPPADVVTANLTGALLIRSAPLLLEAVRDGGVLILSGILAHERDAVREAFADATIVGESHEDEWVGIVLATVAGG